jgi:hypothetical protein
MALPLAFGFYSTVLHKTVPEAAKWGVKPSLEFIPMIFGSLSSGYLNLPFFILLFAAGLISVRESREDAILLSTWIFVPCALSIGIAYLIFFQLRYLIFLLIAYLLVVSRGIMSISNLVIENRKVKGKRMITRPRVSRKKLIILCILAVIIGGSFSALVNYYLYPNREDWKGVASYLNEHTKDGDVIVSLLLSHNLPFQYYYDAKGRELIIPINYTILELEKVTSKNKTTWYIIHKDTVMIDPNLEISNWISANAQPEFLSPYIRIYVSRVEESN